MWWHSRKRWNWFTIFEEGNSLYGNLSLTKKFLKQPTKGFCLWKKWPSTVISKKIKLSQAELSRVKLSQAKLSQVNQIGSSNALKNFVFTPQLYLFWQNCIFRPVVFTGALSWLFLGFPTFGNFIKYLTESKEPSQGIFENYKQSPNLFWKLIHLCLLYKK